ncbi:MAG: NAD(P)H-quinone oxidoreductase [Alphaproteobacteria bacterium]|nr:NAD(P)H-quinone oxidoreductase [Alphaproteobacteria bacterium]
MTVPQTMTVIEVPEPGDADAMKVGTRPVPQPAAGEVLIQVAAAGVNRPDVFQRAGSYPPPPGATDLLGLEAAGTVVALGNDVTEWQVGDAVCALTPGGAYAQYCVTPAAHCLPIPAGFDMVQAASLPETYFTVWHNVFQRGHLEAGEIFLVHGGSSGIGTTAIQLAKQFGATVITTAGSAEKCEACEELGADRAINYREEDWPAVVKEFTEGKGANLILDMVGGDYVQKNINALAWDGRIVNIAFLQGSKVEVNLALFMIKRQTLTASTLRPQSHGAKAKMAAELREKVWPLFDAGKIKTMVYKTFPLTQVAEAHRLMESSAHIGKIVLTVDQE